MEPGLKRKNSLIRNDGIHTSVKTWSKHEETQEEDDDVENGQARFQRRREQFATVEMEVCDGPENEAW